MINIVNINCQMNTIDQFCKLLGLYIYDPIEIASYEKFLNAKNSETYNIFIINCSENILDFKKSFEFSNLSNCFFIAITSTYDMHEENYYLSIGFDTILSLELLHNEFESFIYLLLNKNSKLSIFTVKSDYFDSLGKKRIYDNELIKSLISPDNTTTVRKMRLIGYYSLQKYSCFNLSCLKIVPSLNVYISDNYAQVIDNYLNLILSLTEDIISENNYHFEYKITIIDSKVIFLFYSYTNSISVFLNEEIKFFMILKNKVFLNLNLCFFAGIGKPAFDIIGTDKSYDSANIAVDACFYNSNNTSIISIYDPNFIINPIPTPSTQKSINSLLANNLTVDKFFDVFKSIYDLLEKDIVSPKYVITIVSVLFNKLFFDNTVISYEAKISVYNKFTTNNVIASISSIVLIGKYFQYLIMYSLQFNDLNENKTEAIIKNVKNYIAKNWQRQITLKEIAENIYLNPNYLCDLYKKQTGTHIFTHINEIRILNAKALLITTDKKIFQIGDNIGYPDAASFNRMFKKVVGITPMNYRKRYKKS